MSEDPFKYDRGVLSPLKAQQTISTFTAGYYTGCRIKTCLDIRW